LEVKGLTVTAKSACLLFLHAFFCLSLAAGGFLPADADKEKKRFEISKEAS
jgi:hypothetical protein